MQTIVNLDPLPMCNRPSRRPVFTLDPEMPNPVETPYAEVVGEPVHGHLRRLNSLDLLQGQVEVMIEHHGTTYRLRHTSMGKLILTK